MKVRLVYVLVLVAVIPLLAWNGLVQQLNSQAFDLLMRGRTGARTEATRRIVLVAIDDETARRFGPLPLDRALLAEAVERLATAGPRVIVLDLLLAEPGGPAADRALAKALRVFGRSVVGAAIESDSLPSGRWIWPLPELRAAAAVGHVHVEADPDGVARSVLLAKAAEGRRLWALGLEAVVAYVGAGRPVEAAEELHVGAFAVPAAQRNGRQMLIRYAGREGTFPRVSLASVLDSSFDPAAIRDRIVFLGASAQGSGDRLFTPVSSGIGMSGIEIHANIAGTILDQDFLRAPGAAFELGLYVLVAGLCLGAARRFRGFRLVVVFALLALATPVAAWVALRHGFVWPLGSTLAVLLASGGVAGAGEYAQVALALRSAEKRAREQAFRVQAVAHEIGSPLAAIQGSSEMLREAAVPEQTKREMAGLIHKESRRLHSLIRAFLDVESVAAGTMSLQKRRVELRELCGDVLEQARTYAARKNIEIRAELPAVEVAADGDLLSFAIYNLLTNAVKYSPRRTTIQLRAGSDEESVRISVADQGYGIPPREQQNIFERFYRLKRDQSGPEAGRGIGLALVKEIATQHGGRVEVTSRRGAGSCFTLVLPKG